LESAAGRTVKGIGFLGSTISTALGVGLARAASAGISALTSAFHQGVAGAEQLQSIQAQTAAAIRSTGGAAGLTAKDIRDLALHFEDMSAVVDDKVIQSAENLLLTFTNINKNAFAPTIQAALDINQRLGGGEEGLQSVMLRLGRAMNNPAKGLALLQRSGISLDATTTKQILSLQKQNKLYDAQTLLLDAISTRYGGSFAASANTAAGRAARLRDALDDLRITFASALLPGIENVQAGFTKLFRDPQTVAAIGNFGKQIASFLTPSNVNAGIGALKSAFVSIKGIISTIPFGTIGTSLQIAGRGAKFLLDSFVALPSWVQTAVITGWGLNKLTGGVLGNVVSSLASGLIKGVLGINAGVVNINAGTVTGGGGAIGGLANLTKGGFWKGALNGLTVALATASVVAIGAEIGSAIGNFLIKPTIQPAIDFEAAQFKNFTANKQSVTDIVRAIDSIDNNLKPSLTDLGLSLKDSGAAIALAFDIGGVKTTLNQQRDALIAKLQAQGLTLEQARALLATISTHTASSAATAQKLYNLPGGDRAKAREAGALPTPKPITAAEFERILKTTPFIGTAQYKSIFEQFTTAHPARGGDPFGQNFLHLVSTLANPKAPAVQFEIAGHLKELANLEQYYIAHGDLASAKRTQDTINAINRLIGVTKADDAASRAVTAAGHRATQAAIVRHAAINDQGSRRVANILGTVRIATQGAQNAISAGAARTAAHLSRIEGLDSATAGNTGVIARKPTRFNVVANVNVQSSFSVTALGNQLTHISETVSSQYGGKVVPLG